MEQRKKNLIILSFSHGFNHGLTSVHSIALPLLIPYFLLSYIEASLLSSLFYLTYALLSLPAGKYSTQFGRKNLILFYLLGSFIVTWITGLSPNYILILSLQIIAGALCGIYHPPGVVLLVNSYQQDRGKALGFHEVGGVGGAVIISFFGGIVAKLWGWRYLFYIFSVPGLLIALLCFIWVKEEGLSAKEASKDQVKMNLRPVVAIILCTGIEMMCVTGFRTWLPTLLMDRFRIGIMIASFLSTIVPVTSLMTSPLFGHASDRFGRRIVLYSVLTIFSLSLVGIAYAHSLIWIIPILILTGTVYIAIVPIGNAYLSDNTPPSKRGYIFGIHNMFMSLMSALAPFIVGAMADVFSFRSGMVLLASIAFSGVLIMILIPKREGIFKSQDKR